MKSVVTILTALICTAIGAGRLNAQWIQQHSGTDATLSDVVMLDATTAIAVGRNGSILRTTNAGSTWLDVAAPLSYIQPWSAVSFFDTSNGIVVGDHGVVLTSSNGGKSWIWHQILRDQKCLSALHIAPNSVCVGTDSGWVYNTSDAGKTWSGEKISAWPIRSLFRYRGPTLIGVSKFALTPFSLCTQYVIPPPSWGERILPDFQGLGSAAYDAEFCNGGGSGFIVGVQGDLRSAPTILRKTMTDADWRPVETGVFRDGTFFSVSAPSADVVYVCGSNGLMLKSTNGGDAWIAATLPTTRNLNGICFFDEKRGFAVGDSGLILYTSSGGLTGIDDQKGPLPAGFKLGQNYPNPSNPTTHFEFRIADFEFVSLKIFDLLGRDIATLVDGRMGAGTHTAVWNASGFPSGVYFYRLQTGSYTETKKLVLLR